MIIKTESNTYSLFIYGSVADRGSACVDSIFELFCPRSAKMPGITAGGGIIFEMTAEEFAGALRLLKEFRDRCRSFGVEYEINCKVR